MFNELFDHYYEHVENEKFSEDIFTLFLNEMSDNYKECSSARKVIDYIAGMTDAFFISQYNKYFG